MSRLSHVYLHLGSVGDAEACTAARADMKPVLKAMYAGGETLGYRLFMLNDREEAEEELLHHMFDYEAATSGRFPILYASVTPLDNDDSERAIDVRMKERGFHRFK